jgi:hypothetical protein
MRLQIIEKVARFVPVRFGCFFDRHDLGHSLAACFAAMAERDLSQHDQRPQLPLGQIVRRWNSRIVHEHEPLVVVPL